MASSELAGAPRLERNTGRPPWMSPPSIPARAAKAVVLAIIVVVLLYPLVYVVAMSFADERAATSGEMFPTSFSLDAYRSVMAGNVVSRALLVSAGITVVGTLLSMAFTTTLAYGFSRNKDVPGARTAFMIVLATMFFGAGLIPNYLLVRSLGLIDTYWSLILPSLVSVFNLVVVRNFFMNLPGELTESARIDGAGDWRIFLQIILPLSKPVLAVISLFYAVAYWNIFFNALIYLKDATMWPIQPILNQYVVQGSSITEIADPDRPPPAGQTVQMVVIVLATLPILIVYPFVQRFFTKGMLTGAIKG